VSDRPPSPGEEPPGSPVHAPSSPGEGVELFRAMVRTRAAEEHLEGLVREGLAPGPVHRSLGQEAVAVGAAWALRRRGDGTGDVVAPSHRAAGAVLLFSQDATPYFRQNLGRGTSPTRGRDGLLRWSDLSRGLLGPVSPPGSTVEVMAGITLAFRLRGEDRVGMVFAGDGASSTGGWHEGLNLAAVQRCPMVLVVEANSWAYATPTSRQTRVASFLEKCEGYGIEGSTVDGTDVLAVVDAAREAVDRSRNGGGVHLLEIRAYRRGGHGQEDPRDYMDPEELQTWEARDPLEGLRSRLLEAGQASQALLRQLEADAAQEMEAAAQQALGEPDPDPEEARRGVWVDLEIRPPWYRTPGGRAAVIGDLNTTTGKGEA
jgi:TPP-dependent pyruvate/acetoin dehydrogenase alpha subunit